MQMVQYGILVVGWTMEKPIPYSDLWRKFPFTFEAKNIGLRRLLSQICSSALRIFIHKKIHKKST